MYTARLLFFSALSFLSALPGAVHGQHIATSQYSALRWRSIGPYRGGRTVGAAGVPAQPNVFYIGVNNGGVWKTTDYGQTWFSVFDDQPTGSIGCVGVSVSDPDIVYAGSGEGLHRPDLSVGDGIYKSTDAGRTWKHLGLRDGQQIPQLAIDEKNPDRLFVAVLGHPYGPNEERGIFRSLDGGESFEKVLYVDENTGGDDVALDPTNANIVYATLWKSREGPWENGEWSDTTGGIFKSTDGGNTWRKLTNGLPGNTVQAHIAISHSNPNILYTSIGTTENNEYGTGKGMGIYRSADGGESWHEVSRDGRPEARIGGGDVPVLQVDPINPDIVYSASIVLWKSIDGGKTWKGIRGAPGGDDYQNLWINPLNTNIILTTGDQGAVISVNGGDTWSSWYNQPTSQLYHVSADNDFPYNVYSGQQESGSVGISSRGNDGQITFREWHPVGAQEYGYVVADPLNSNIVYGGKISKYNKLTGQTHSITPRPDRNEKFRFVRTEPVVFSPVNNKTLYYAGNVLFSTNDGGDTWSVISPDLSREQWSIPSSVGIYQTANLKSMPRRGVIYTVSPSPLDNNTIWAGTDDGLIHLTNDGGKTWSNLTPPVVESWSKISIIDAGHFNVNTAYVAVNRFRCDDQKPYIYRTHDGGKSWQAIVAGLPDDPINAVREDPQTEGLLFASSERSVYVSFDDGEFWQPLRLNMPATSVRDIIIKDNDLVAATHGRGFWILDDISPLRQLAKSDRGKPVLFKPGLATRVRWNTNTDTPLPPEEPAGENPPDGAIIYYYLPGNAKSVALSISDKSGNVLRQYSSDDTLFKIPEINVPLYWFRPQQRLSTSAGSHRCIFDLHVEPLPVPPTFAISAIYKNTAPEPTSPWINPGMYTVTLVVDGVQYSQSLDVRMDPRVKISSQALELQFALSKICYDSKLSIINKKDSILRLTRQVQPLSKTSNKSLASRLESLLSQLNGLVAGDSTQNLNNLEGAFNTMFQTLQEADVPPSPESVRTVGQLHSQLGDLEKSYYLLKQQLRLMNRQLRSGQILRL